MIYIIHQYDPYSDSWFTVKESPNFDDFSKDPMKKFGFCISSPYICGIN